MKATLTQMESEKTKTGPLKRLNPNQQKEAEEEARRQEQLAVLKNQISYLTEQNQK